MAAGRLVLSRKRSESILIDVPGRATPIEVCVAYIRGNRATLAIAAEKDVRIRRGELAEEHFDLGNPVG